MHSFTSRAVPLLVPQPHRANTLPAPTCAPHRLQKSQVIEQLAQTLELPGMRRLGLGDQRLTHQAYDQAVALDGAHALLQLKQDLVLVLDVAALRLPSERGGLGPSMVPSVITAKGPWEGAVRG